MVAVAVAHVTTKRAANAHTAERNIGEVVEVGVANEKIAASRGHGAEIGAKKRGAGVKSEDAGLVPDHLLVIGDHVVATDHTIGRAAEVRGKSLQSKNGIKGLFSVFNWQPLSDNATWSSFSQLWEKCVKSASFWTTKHANIRESLTSNFTTCTLSHWHLH